jgi:hypothetical protein
MVSLTQLWLPLLLSAVAVFFVSFATHMLLKYHNTDFARLPNEDSVMAALSQQNVPVGEYMFPHHGGASNPMKDPAFVEKRNRGPAGILTVMPTPMPGLGGYLAQWFVYSLVVSLFAAYLASRALAPGAEGGEVFRFTATVAFLGYGLALIHDSIWFGRPWSTTLKNLFDALLYAAATGAVFLWLWP